MHPRGRTRQDPAHRRRRVRSDVLPAEVGQCDLGRGRRRHASPDRQGASRRDARHHRRAGTARRRNESGPGRGRADAHRRGHRHGVRPLRLPRRRPATAHARRRLEQGAGHRRSLAHAGFAPPAQSRRRPIRDLQRLPNRPHRTAARGVVGAGGSRQGPQHRLGDRRCARDAAGGVLPPHHGHPRRSRGDRGRQEPAHRAVRGRARQAALSTSRGETAAAGDLGDPPREGTALAGGVDRRMARTGDAHIGRGRNHLGATLARPGRDRSPAARGRPRPGAARRPRHGRADDRR